jgi:deoxyribonuclease IV
MYGSHLSISGGMHNALTAAETMGFDTVQVFTKNQQQWRVPPLSDAAVGEWQAHQRRLKFETTVSHDSYLINLASPDEVIRRKSIALFIEEVSRCEVLEIPLLVTHPGAHMGQGEEVGLRRVAEALDEVHAALPAAKTITCLEITAGQGTSLGYRLEHLAEIIAQVKLPGRLGVCLDTAHLFAAGYDFRGRKFPAFMREVEKTVGYRAIRVLHVNDSKKPLGSRVDRHEHIGRGEIGLDGFRPLVRERRFAKIPKILETPKGKDAAGREWDTVNLETLRGLE